MDVSDALLVCIDSFSEAHIVAVRGKGVRRAQTDGGAYGIEEFGFDEDNIPSDRGLHVWEGTITLTVDGEPFVGDSEDWEIVLDGEWRRATADDLIAFGVPLAAAPSAAKGGDHVHDSK